jgi:hypothetical protein
MSEAFQKMKARRMDPEKVRERWLALIKPDFGQHRATRVRRALARTDLGKQIAGCSRKRACGSLWCERCRKRLVDRLSGRFTTRFQKALGSDEALARQRFKFLTVLDSVVGFDQAAIVDRAGIIRRHLAAVARDVRGLDVWLRGAIEVELIDRALLKSVGTESARKKKVIDMLAGTAAPIEKSALVHFHALVDLGRSGDGVVRDALAKRWGNVPWQIDLKSMFAGKNMEQSLKHMAEYCLKGGNEALRYKLTFGRDSAYLDDAQMWRSGGMTRDEDLYVEDARALSLGDIRFLVEALKGLMTPDAKGLLVSIGFEDI